jgi:drug/metabolite transporter (DMT)-like permease
MRANDLLYPRIALGIVAVSFGAIFARLAGEAPSFAVAAWRLTLAALFLAPLTLFRRERTMDRRSLVWSVLSGVALAVHFVLWISSLEYTTVASSVLFMSTHPIFVGLGSILFLRERLSRVLLMGIVLAVLGGALIGFGDFRFGGLALRGDLLALGGGVMAAAYFLIGRRVRRTVSLAEYVATSYGTAAAVVLLLCLATRTRLVGFAPSTYGYLVLLAVVPQMIGHSTINWALKRLSASRVSVFVLGEPVAATLLAIGLFGEVPSGLNLLGAAIILLGIYLSLRSEEEQDGTEP